MASKKTESFLKNQQEKVTPQRSFATHCHMKRQKNAKACNKQTKAKRSSYKWHSNAMGRLLEANALTTALKMRGHAISIKYLLVTRVPSYMFPNSAFNSEHCEGMHFGPIVHCIYTVYRGRGRIGTAKLFEFRQEKRLLYPFFGQHHGIHSVGRTLGGFVERAFPHYQKPCTQIVTCSSG